jgi:hypothetical protein
MNPADIIENPEAALDQFRGVVEGLENQQCTELI